MTSSDHVHFGFVQFCVMFHFLTLLENFISVLKIKLFILKFF